MSKIDLPRLFRAQGRRRRSKAMAAIRPRLNQAAELAAIMVQVVRFWRDVAANQLLNYYEATLRERDPLPGMRDSVSDLERVLSGSDDALYRLILRLTPELKNWTVRAEKVHRASFVANAKVVTGIDLSTVISEGGVQTTIDAILQRNVALITNLSDASRSKVSEILFAGIQNRTPRVDVAKLINEGIGIQRDRALRIASDQSTKLSASLDRERQEEIGITQFIWQHSGKVHFRPEHKERDGQVFSWDDPDIADDLPGMAINCGCKAKGYVEGIS